MIDKITLERIGTAHPKERDNMSEMYHRMAAALTGRCIVRFAYVTRTFSEQHALFLKGRDGKGGKKVTWADQGLSYHNYGLAFDIVLLKDTDGNGTFDAASWETNVDFDGDGKADWMEVVEIAKQYGYEWGGTWRDPKTDKPHFQKTYGYTVQQLLDKFNRHDFIPNTNYVKI